MRLHLLSLVPLALVSCALAGFHPRALVTPTATNQPEMIAVPAGLFTMGSDAGPASSHPARDVFLDAYFIDRTEVRIGDLEAFAAETHTTLAASEELFALGDKSLPAYGVVWAEAEAYCRRVGKRLPSEAEWEKAARGVDARQYPWGDDWRPGLANTRELDYGRVLAVATLPEGNSPYGVMDMAGNVAEWVADYFDPSYYSYAPLRNPTGPALILDHGLRGGSWNSTREQVTTYFRDSSHSVQPNNRVGFRCAAAQGLGGLWPVPPVALSQR